MIFYFMALFIVDMPPKNNLLSYLSNTAPNRLNIEFITYNTNHSHEFLDGEFCFRKMFLFKMRTLSCTLCSVTDWFQN